MLVIVDISPFTFRINTPDIQVGTILCLFIAIRIIIEGEGIAIPNRIFLITCQVTGGCSLNTSPVSWVICIVNFGIGFVHMSCIIGCTGTTHDAGTFIKHICGRSYLTCCPPPFSYKNRLQICITVKHVRHICDFTCFELGQIKFR